MRSYIPAYPDPNITPEEACRRLSLDKVVVGWYSNRRVRQIGRASCRERV